MFGTAERWAPFFEASQFVEHYHVWDAIIFRFVADMRQALIDAACQPVVINDQVFLVYFNFVGYLWDLSPHSLPKLYFQVT